MTASMAELPAIMRAMALVLYVVLAIVGGLLTFVVLGAAEGY